MKDSRITFRKCLDYLRQTQFPIELIQEISKWGLIHKSPYGLSFYNATVDWGSKPHGSLRISDHWNFKSKGIFHCETTTHVPDKTHWAIGQYDETIKKYVIIKVYKASRTQPKDTFWFRYFMLHEAFKISISNSTFFDNAKHVEYSYLNKYYRLLEEYFVNPENLPTFA